VVRVGDTDQSGGPLAQRPAAQLGDNSVSDDLVDGVLERRDDVTGVELGDDLGDIPPLAADRRHHEVVPPTWSTWRPVRIPWPVSRWWHGIALSQVRGTPEALLTFDVTRRSLVP
jgi:hypothetical protein